MTYERLIKRIPYQVKCNCGYSETWNNRPPREVQCPNFKLWLKPESIFQAGQALKG